MHPHQWSEAQLFTVFSIWFLVWICYRIGRIRVTVNTLTTLYKQCLIIRFDLFPLESWSINCTKIPILQRWNHRRLSRQIWPFPKSITGLRWFFEAGSGNQRRIIWCSKRNIILGTEDHHRRLRTRSDPMDSTGIISLLTTIITLLIAKDCDSCRSNSWSRWRA